MSSVFPETSIANLPDIRDTTPPKYLTTPDLLVKVKEFVMKWLESDDEDARIDFKMESDIGIRTHLCFERYVINAKLCSNSWEEIHIASSPLWPETYALSKRTYCDNRCKHIPRNEIISSTSRLHECNFDPVVIEADRIVNDARSQDASDYNGC
jgi:hypothetical protein